MWATERSSDLPYATTCILDWFYSDPLYFCIYLFEFSNRSNRYVESSGIVLVLSSLPRISRNFCFMYFIAIFLIYKGLWPLYFQRLSFLSIPFNLISSLLAWNSVINIATSAFFLSSSSFFKLSISLISLFSKLSL